MKRLFLFEPDLSLINQLRPLITECDPSCQEIAEAGSLNQAYEMLLQMLGERLSQQLQLLFCSYQLWLNDKVVLHLAEGIHLLPLREVIRLESEGCYTTFFTTQNEGILVTKPIGEFDYLTHKHGFFRVHQSHVVNLNFVRQVLREDGGFVVLDGGAKVPVARRRKEEFLKILTGGR